MPPRCRQPGAATPTAATVRRPRLPLRLLSLQDYPLQPLVDDCRLLGSLLDDCLRIEVGEELFQKVRARAGGGLLVCMCGGVGICGGPPSGKACCQRMIHCGFPLPHLPCLPQLSSPPVQIERIRTLSDCAQQLNSSHDKDAGRYLGQARQPPAAAPLLLPYRASCGLPPQDTCPALL